MSAVKIKKHQFTGLSKVYSRDPDGLAAILRGLAIDNARIALEKSVYGDTCLIPLFMLFLRYGGAGVRQLGNEVSVTVYAYTQQVRRLVRRIECVVRLREFAESQEC